VKSSHFDCAPHQREFPAGSACFSMLRAVSGKEVRQIGLRG
jgi:hypothetical protein